MDDLGIGLDIGPDVGLRQGSGLLTLQARLLLGRGNLVSLDSRLVSNVLRLTRGSDRGDPREYGRHQRSSPE